MKGLYIEDLTWNEFETRIRDDTVVLVPLGARLKEHGYHLPLNTDWITAEYLARRVVEQCDVMVTPTVQFSYYPAFVEYPGSVHIGLDTARQMLNDLVTSIAWHGPVKFYVLNTGVSTNRVLEPLRLQLQERGIDLEYLDLLRQMSEFEAGIAEQESGSHADEIETSIMLYIAPDKVRMDKAVDETGPREPGRFTRSRASRGHYSPSGAWGRPTLATAEKGKLVIGKMLETVLADIAALREPGFEARPPVYRYLS